jgi:hypothetical protein
MWLDPSLGVVEIRGCFIVPITTSKSLQTNSHGNAWVPILDQKSYTAYIKVISERTYCLWGRANVSQTTDQPSFYFNVRSYEETPILTIYSVAFHSFDTSLARVAVSYCGTMRNELCSTFFST